MIKLKVVTLSVFLFSYVSIYSQQDKTVSNSSIQEPVSCDQFIYIMDRAMEEVQKRGDQSYFIVIFRLGATEKKDSLNIVRMREVEKFIQFRGALIPYVLGIGDRADRIGEANIYVGGRLTAGFFFAPNSKQVCDPNEW